MLISSVVDHDTEQTSLTRRMRDTKVSKKDICKSHQPHSHASYTLPIQRGFVMLSYVSELVTIVAGNGLVATGRTGLNQCLFVGKKKPLSINF